MLLVGGKLQVQLHNFGSSSSDGNRVLVAYYLH